VGKTQTNGSLNGHANGFVQSEFKLDPIRFVLPEGKKRHRTKHKQYRINVPVTADEEAYFKMGASLMGCSLCDLFRTLLTSALEPYKQEVEAALKVKQTLGNAIKMKKDRLNTGR
jgi:hypothetical protein